MECTVAVVWGVLWRGPPSLDWVLLLVALCPVCATTLLLWHRHRLTPCRPPHLLCPPHAWHPRWALCVTLLALGIHASVGALFLAALLHALLWVHCPLLGVRVAGQWMHPREWRARRQLAACYQLADLMGLSDTIYGHLTARCSPATGHPPAFLINPFGAHFAEVTASSLVKVNLEGEVLNPGEGGSGVINRAGYVLHSAVHAARPDVECVMHTHAREAVAVSCHRRGLQHVLSQTAQIVGPASYHDHEGIAIHEEERTRLVKDLGPHSKVMFLRNHGILLCGASIPEAFFLMLTTVEACKIQVLAMSLGSSDTDLLRPSEEVAAATHSIAASFCPEGRGVKELNALIRVYLEKGGPQATCRRHPYYL